MHKEKAAFLAAFSVYNISIFNLLNFPGSLSLSFGILCGNLEGEA